MEPIYLVECFWPGLTRETVLAADSRVRSRVTQLCEEGSHLRYLGSLLLSQDEVVFFQFQASSPEQVSLASTEAGISFERVVESVRVESAPSGGDRGVSRRRSRSGRSKEKGEEQ
jgi:hypothetical protein